MKKATLWFCVVALLVLTGCTSQSVRVAEQYPQVHFASDVSGVNLYAVSDTVLHDGNIQVVVSGRSSSQLEQRLRYRAIWFDASGAPINTVVSSWNRMTLQKGQPFDIKLIGPGRHAARYRIEFQKDA